MVRFNTFYYSMILALCSCGNTLLGQGNCLVFPAESGERLACELSYRAIAYPQGSKESQLLFDAAIRIGPKYAWAYYEKSVPFFKRGLLAEGVSLINKAIELEPQNYLYYRAYWYFYNRSYRHCVNDLEELYTAHNTLYNATPSGELEMRLLLAMAYAHTGEVPKAISWVQNLLDLYEKQPGLQGYYDYYCLGVLYYLNHQPALAQTAFAKQLTINAQFAGTYYYLGLLKEQEKEDTQAQEYFQQALAMIKGENGGYSPNFFTEWNVDREEVERKLRSK